MTSYEKGFLTKCAEYGIDGRQLLYKKAGFGALLPLLNKVLRNKYTAKLSKSITDKYVLQSLGAAGLIGGGTIAGSTSRALADKAIIDGIENNLNSTQTDLQDTLNSNKGLQNELANTRVAYSKLQNDYNALKNKPSTWQQLKLDAKNQYRKLQQQYTNLPLWGKILLGTGAVGGVGGLTYLLANRNKKKRKSNKNNDNE